MGAIFVILLLFLGIGIFARTYNVKTRLLMVALVVGLLLYFYLT